MWTLIFNSGCRMPIWYNNIRAQMVFCKFDMRAHHTIQTHIHKNHNKMVVRRYRPRIEFIEYKLCAAASSVGKKDREKHTTRKRERERKKERLRDLTCQNHQSHLQILSRILMECSISIQLIIIIYIEYSFLTCYLCCCKNDNSAIQQSIAFFICFDSGANIAQSYRNKCWLIATFLFERTRKKHQI